MNITGSWTYNEDFEFGKSFGKVEFVQKDNLVVGTFSFTEKVENNYEIEVTETVEGTIDDGKVLLKSTNVTAIQNGREINYLPNTFDVHLVSDHKLVGSTFDSEDVCGVFVLERI